MLLRLRILLPTRYWLLLAFAIIGITGGYEPAHSAVLTVWATPAIAQSYQNTDAGARATFDVVGTQSITLRSAQKSCNLRSSALMQIKKSAYFDCEVTDGGIE